MNPDQTAPSDLGPYCLQSLKQMREQMSVVMNGRERVKLEDKSYTYLHNLKDSLVTSICMSWL